MFETLGKMILLVDSDPGGGKWRFKCVALNKGFHHWGGAKVIVAASEFDPDVRGVIKFLIRSVSDVTSVGRWRRRTHWEPLALVRIKNRYRSEWQYHQLGTKHR